MYRRPTRALLLAASCSTAVLTAACSSADRALGPSTANALQETLLALPKSIDTLAVGDSVQYVPLGTLAHAEADPRWSSAAPSLVSVRQDGWIKALAVGTTTVSVAVQAAPFPHAATQITVVERSAGHAVSRSTATLQSTGAMASITTRANAAMCVDVFGGGAVAGARVGIWPCNGQANEQFAWQSDGSIHYGALCLDAAGGTGKNGDPIIAWTCNGGANQRWTGTTDGQIQGINGRCIDLPGGNTSSGTGLVLWDCNGGTNQRWDDHPISGQVRGQVVAGVAIYPGTSIQTVVNANPAGTTFILKAGTHTNQSVVPKSGDVFYGESGAVLDGGNSVQYAFWTGANAPYPSNVRIHGLKITRYAPPPQLGAVRAGGNTAAEGSTGWMVDSCEVSYNATSGIRVGHRMQVLSNNVHHNGQIGINGVGDSVRVEGNEIAYNNYQQAFDAGWEAGGTKFVLTHGLIVRGNFSHHNMGAGLWTDENNINTLYENNRVEDNAGSGIFHEISYAAVIRNNTAARNGFAQGGWVYGGGITVAASPDVEIYGNTVTNNYNGITGMQQQRGTGLYGPHVIHNLFVHDNVVTMTTGRTGIGEDIGDQSIFTSWGNRFSNNTYNIAGNTAPFEWMDAMRTDTQWRAFGQDVAGHFSAVPASTVGRAGH